MMMIYQDIISKRAQDAILDNQLLDMVRLWLEPLPDRSLPSLDIQNELLDALDKVCKGKLDDDRI